jgi:hypothetical protein
MKTHPYVVKSDATGEQLAHIKDSDSHFDERWLQELLRQHPDILPTSEIEAIYTPLIPIGREVGVSVGAIDNLFISQFGYLVLVETKLWRNPEARREVLAQAIDYGVSLSKWKFEQLDRVTRSYTSRYEGGEYGLIDWVEQKFGLIEQGKVEFENQVSTNIRLGRFLTLIVGDRIKQSLIDVLSDVNRYPQLSMNVGLVELACYRLHQNQDWPLVVVPNLIAKTEIFQRSVVEVTLVGQKEYHVEVSQQKESSGGKRQKREFLTEETYWQLLHQRAPEALLVTQQVIDRYREIEGILIEPWTGSIVAKMFIQDSGEKVTLFYVDTNGKLMTWPDTIRGQIVRAGINGDLAEPYKAGMSRLLNCAKEMCSKLITKIDLPAFYQAAEDFIQSVQHADREE